MKRGVLSLLAAATAFATSAVAADFDSLKKLAGDWQMTGATGSALGAASYRVTSNGSAVVETIFIGTPHEMMTMYTRDGNKIAVTHYCAGGNQPHLVSKAPAGDQIGFDFVSAGNLKSINEDHMHSLTVTFVDANQVKQEWVNYKDGKAAGTTVINFKRKA